MIYFSTPKVFRYISWQLSRNISQVPVPAGPVHSPRGMCGVVRVYYPTRTCASTDHQSDTITKSPLQKTHISNL